MIGRKELRRAFENKPFVTKKYVLERMGYKTYKEIRRFFRDLQHIGCIYLTEDVIDLILKHVEYPENA